MSEPMNIDWDNLAEEIEDSPRARLLQALAQADEMMSVVIAYELKDGSHMTSGFEYVMGLAPSAGSASFLGLAEFVRADILDGMLHGKEEE